jgi:hypothetical protein
MNFVNFLLMSALFGALGFPLVAQAQGNSARAEQKLFDSPAFDEQADSDEQKLKRLTELRSALQVLRPKIADATSATPVQPAARSALVVPPSATPRQMSSSEREQMRQQLRQQRQGK